jgi:hypothetical protein
VAQPGFLGEWANMGGDFTDKQKIFAPTKY